VFSEHARERFYTHFGPLNQVVQVTSQSSLVILDAPQLVDEDDERVSYGFSFERWAPSRGTLEFVKTLPDTPGHAAQLHFSHSLMIQQA
jgi:hypothetical protein